MKYIAKKDLKLNKRGQRKGDNGRVLIVGGSEDYVGCLVLAGLAALRCGADWVTVAAPEKIGWAIHSYTSELVVRKVKGRHFVKKHINQILKLEKRFDVVLLGNGISLKAKKFIKSFVKKTKKPLVIDADALKVVSLKDIRNSILTPHKKEFESLLRNSGIINGKGLDSSLIYPPNPKLTNKKISENNMKLVVSNELIKNIQQMLDNNVIILKGKVDEIITSKEIFYNKTGNAGMSKAGTGDFLAGLCAGFYAQTHDALKAAKMAAYYNGLVGDLLLKKKKGFTYLASDMVEEIGKVFGRKV